MCKCSIKISTTTSRNFYGIIIVTDQLTTSKSVVKDHQILNTKLSTFFSISQKITRRLSNMTMFGIYLWDLMMTTFFLIAHLEFYPCCCIYMTSLLTSFHLKTRGCFHFFNRTFLLFLIFLDLRGSLICFPSTLVRILLHLSLNSNITYLIFLPL